MPLTNVEPVAFRVIVQPDPVLEKTQSGIILAQDKRLAANAQVWGTVLAIGEDVYANFKPKRQFAGLKVGDRVAYAKYAGKWLDDETLVLIDEDIVAKEVKNDVDAAQA